MYVNTHVIIGNFYTSDIRETKLIEYYSIVDPFRLPNVQTIKCRMFVVVSALKIHMSKNAHDALRAFPEFVTECRNYFYDEVVNDYNLKSIF